MKTESNLNQGSEEAEPMNHENESGWRMWIPMILCCAVMIAVVVLLAAGGLSLF